MSRGRGVPKPSFWTISLGRAYSRAAGTALGTIYTTGNKDKGTKHFNVWLQNLNPLDIVLYTDGPQEFISAKIIWALHIKLRICAEKRIEPKRLFKKRLREMSTTGVVASHQSRSLHRAWISLYAHIHTVLATCSFCSVPVFSLLIHHVPISLMPCKIMRSRDITENMLAGEGHD